MQVFEQAAGSPNYVVNAIVPGTVLLGTLLVSDFLTYRGSFDECEALRAAGFSSTVRTATMVAGLFSISAPAAVCGPIIEGDPLGRALANMGAIELHGRGGSEALFFLARPLMFGSLWVSGRLLIPATGAVEREGAARQAVLRSSLLATGLVVAMLLVGNSEGWWYSLRYPRP